MTDLTHDRPNLTILITAYREPNTIGGALEAILPQAAPLNAEIMVICPDDETAHAASRFSGVKVLRDLAQGKPAALNLGLSAARGSLIAMTDGDVTLAPAALEALVKFFDNPQTGAVSGHPISTSPRNTVLGYWSHVLTDAGAHAERSKRERAGEFMVCSGYLYAIRAGLVTHIPEGALAEDAVVSQQVAERGYKVRYAPDAKVFVKYPATYHDWLIQKVRSVGGYAQPVIANSQFQMRSFRHEATAGLWRSLAYAHSPRELLYIGLLILARLHLWLLIFWEVRLRKRPLAELWQRVESTK